MSPPSNYCLTHFLLETKLRRKIWSCSYIKSSRSLKKFKIKGMVGEREVLSGLFGGPGTRERICRRLNEGGTRERK
jgi:hypothetical protein